MVSGAFTVTMQLTLVDGLPFITVGLGYNRQQIDVPSVLIDTGSASTVFSSDWGRKIGITPEPSDTIRTLWGVGGSEVVFARKVSHVKVGAIQLPGFEVEFSGMQYGFQINGILGMDFLLKTRAVIDLDKLILTFSGN